MNTTNNNTPKNNARSGRYPHRESIEQQRQQQLQAIRELRAKLSPAKQQPVEAEAECTHA